jgi:RNA polymerase sigma-70 factor (ECF subfamily)
VTESEFLNKIKDDPTLFSEIFKLYYIAIFGYILRRTGDFDETADIAAETFLKAFLNIRKFSFKGISIKVWLYRIAINELNQQYRQKQRRKILFDKVSFDNKELFNQYLTQDREEIEIELQKHEQFNSVLRILNTLPIKYQEVISLKYFEGKNNKEIAEILGLNKGTLKSLLSRGIEKLRKGCNQL